MTDIELPVPFIRDGIEEGVVIPFLGSGASLGGIPGQGLPTARVLALQLAETTRFPKDLEPDLATVAQWYQLVLGRRPLHRTLRKVFSPRSVAPMALHRWLAGIHTPLLIITTNYDDLIEQAFDEAGKPYDLVVHTTDPEIGDRVLWWPHGDVEPQLICPTELDIDLESTAVIYKMHGGIDPTLDSRDQYVVTEDDYIDFLTRLTAHTAIPSIFAEPFESRHFLFLGYGLRDWNLRVVLHRVQKDLHRAGELTSWAIDAAPSTLEQRFWQTRGVEVVKMTITDFLGEIVAD